MDTKDIRDQLNMKIADLQAQVRSLTALRDAVQRDDQVAIGVGAWMMTRDSTRRSNHMPNCIDCDAPFPSEECEDCASPICWRCSSHGDGFCEECIDEWGECDDDEDEDEFIYDD